MADLEVAFGTISQDVMLVAFNKAATFDPLPYEL